MSMIRFAAADDAAFLQQMLALAADWRSEAPRSVAELMGEPTLAHYIIGWPKAGDLGVIAVDERPIGAAWWRFFTADDPGYGFVDTATPEVSVAVISQARRRGVGEGLLQALVAEADRRNLPALSLSVEQDNPATQLYEGIGFRTISRTSALTMVLRLRGPDTPRARLSQ